MPRPMGIIFFFPFSSRGMTLIHDPTIPVVLWEKKRPSRITARMPRETAVKAWPGRPDWRASFLQAAVTHIASFFFFFK